MVKDLDVVDKLTINCWYAEAKKVD